MNENPKFEREFELLAAGVELQRGRFGLLIATCDSPSTAWEILRRLTTLGQSGGWKIGIHAFAAEPGARGIELQQLTVLDLMRELRDRSYDAHVISMTDRPDVDEEFLFLCRNLNRQRDTLAREVPCPLVLLLSQHHSVPIEETAPDLSSMAKRYTFSSPVVPVPRPSIPPPSGHQSSASLYRRMKDAVRDARQAVNSKDFVRAGNALIQAEDSVAMLRESDKDAGEDDADLVMLQVYALRAEIAAARSERTAVGEMVDRIMDHSLLKQSPPRELVLALCESMRNLALSLHDRQYREPATSIWSFAWAHAEALDDESRFRLGLDAARHFWKHEDARYTAILVTLQKLSEGDTGREIALSKFATDQLARLAGELASATGPYRPDRHVSRPPIERTMEQRLLFPGVPVLLMGAHGYGKTWLAEHVLTQLRTRMPLLVVRMNFNGYDSGGVMPTFSTFANRFNDDLVQRMPEEFRPRKGDVDALSAEPLTDPLQCTEILELCLRAAGDRVVCLLMELPSAMFSWIDARLFFAMMQLWNEKAATPPWDRLRMVHVLHPKVAIETYQNVSKFKAARIDLPPFDLDAIREMASLHDAGSGDVPRLFEETGGHPALVRAVLNGYQEEGKLDRALEPSINAELDGVVDWVASRIPSERNELDTRLRRWLSGHEPLAREELEDLRRTGFVDASGRVLPVIQRLLANARP